MGNVTSAHAHAMLQTHATARSDGAICSSSRSGGGGGDANVGGSSTSNGSSMSISSSTSSSTLKPAGANVIDHVTFVHVPRFVQVVIEVPKGSFVKRHGDGSIDYVGFLPCPFNYGSVPAFEALDGDPLDAIVLGPGLPYGSRDKWRVQALLRFTDAGHADHKLVCTQARPPPSRPVPLLLPLPLRIPVRLPLEEGDETEAAAARASTAIGGVRVAGAAEVAGASAAAEAAAAAAALVAPAATAVGASAATAGCRKVPAEAARTSGEVQEGAASAPDPCRPLPPARPYSEGKSGTLEEHHLVRPRHSHPSGWKMQAVGADACLRMPWAQDSRWGAPEEGLFPLPDAGAAATAVAGTPGPLQALHRLADSFLQPLAVLRHKVVSAVAATLSPGASAASAVGASSGTMVAPAASGGASDMHSGTAFVSLRLVCPRGCPGRDRTAIVVPVLSCQGLEECVACGGQRLGDVGVGRGGGVGDLERGQHGCAGDDCGGGGNHIGRSRRRSGILADVHGGEEDGATYARGNIEGLTLGEAVFEGEDDNALMSRARESMAAAVAARAAAADAVAEAAAAASYGVGPSFALSGGEPWWATPRASGSGGVSVDAGVGVGVGAVIDTGVGAESSRRGMSPGYRYRGEMEGRQRMGGGDRVGKGEQNVTGELGGLHTAEAAAAAVVRDGYLTGYVWEAEGSEGVNGGSRGTSCGKRIQVPEAGVQRGEGTDEVEEREGADEGDGYPHPSISEHTMYRTSPPPRPSLATRLWRATEAAGLKKSRDLGEGGPSFVRSRDLVCLDFPLHQYLMLSLFFHFFAFCKRIHNEIKGQPGRTAFDGWEVVAWPQRRHRFAALTSHPRADPWRPAVLKRPCDSF